MARGGKRPGAGRKKGETTKKTREIADRAAKEGITPLEVMIKAMRTEAAKQDLLPATDRDYSEAAKFANMAAPYMHPRLSSVAHTGKVDSSIEFSDVPATEVARRYAFLLQSAAKAESEQPTEH